MTRYATGPFTLDDLAAPAEPRDTVTFVLDDGRGSRAGSGSVPHDPPPKLAAVAHAPLRKPAAPLPPGFPRLNAYVFTYPPNRASLDLTLDDFRRSDWGADPAVFVQPADWPKYKESASRNYRRVLEQALADACEFALVLEDDVRVCRRLRRTLATLPLVRRGQCDYLGLYLPDLIADPWDRAEPNPGSQLAEPCPLVGPKQVPP